jgi:hypothetical protein
MASAWVLGAWGSVIRLEIAALPAVAGKAAGL